MSRSENPIEFNLTLGPDFGPLTRADTPLYESVISSLEPLVEGSFDIVALPTDERVIVRFSGPADEVTSHFNGVDLFNGFLAAGMSLRDGLRRQKLPDSQIMQVVSSHIRFAATALEPGVNRRKLSR